MQDLHLENGVRYFLVKPLETAANTNINSSLHTCSLRTCTQQNQQLSITNTCTMSSGTNRHLCIHAHRSPDSDHRSAPPPPAPRGTNTVDLPDVSPVETEEFMQWMYWREEERKAGRLSETAAPTRVPTRITTSTTTTCRYQSYSYLVRR
jgi:hypothetical protein